MKDLISKFKENWKEYSIYGGIAIVSLIIGMTATELDTLKQILISLVPQIIITGIWIGGIIIVSKIIGKSISNLGKKIPEFLTQYEKIKIKAGVIDRARGVRLLLCSLLKTTPFRLW